VDSGRRGHGTDADEEEEKIDCLARWIFDMKDNEERRRFIAKMQLHKGQAFADDLKLRVKAELEKRNSS